MLRPGKRINLRRLSPLALLALLSAILLVPPLALGPHPGASAPTSSPAAAAPPPAASDLPLGGRVVLPTYRVVAVSGAPEVPPIGKLSASSPDQAIQRLTQLAAGFGQPGRPVLPALELGAVLATQTPGPDGKYRFRQPDGVIQTYLDAARRGHGLLVLDIQPGRSDFTSEIGAYRRYLDQPDVGLALEPAWQLGPMGPGGQPNGSIDANEVNAIVASLADTVQRGRLPQKLLVVHEVTAATVRGQRSLRADPAIAVVLSADGSGDQQTKLASYHSVTSAAGATPSGVTVFSHQDKNPMSPAELLRLRPAPDLIDYR